MDNIEQLKQDNAKLTERLNNAAKFFREQKAQIESLTNEVKERTSLAMDYRNQIEDLTKENKELKNNQNIVDPNTITELNKRVKELNNTIDSKDKAYKVLQDTYNELYGENSKLKEDLEKRTKNLRAVENTAAEEQNKLVAARDEWMNKYNEIKPKYDEVFKASVDLGKEIAELKVKYTNKTKEQEDIINSLKKENKESEEAAKKIMDSYENDIKKLKADNEKLNEIYNNLENEKLAIESDYQAQLAIYKELQGEYERLRNETEIYSQSDTTLAEIANILIEKGLVSKTEITPKIAIKESGTSHRMGDSLITGKNVGV